MLSTRTLLPRPTHQMGNMDYRVEVHPFACCLTFIAIESYERQHLQKELSEVSAWLDRNVPYFAVIEYAGDKVLGTGSEKLDYIHISDCAMQFQRTFRSNIVAGLLLKKIYATVTDYLERFAPLLPHSRPASRDSTDFRDMKYSAIRMGARARTLISHTDY